MAEKNNERKKKCNLCKFTKNGLEWKKKNDNWRVRKKSWTEWQLSHFDLHPYFHLSFLHDLKRKQSMDLSEKHLSPHFFFLFLLLIKQWKFSIFHLLSTESFSFFVFTPRPNIDLRRVLKKFWGKNNRRYVKNSWWNWKRLLTTPKKKIIL